GTFAAFYAIYNQPANIIASSLNNLINAKQVEINGSVNVGLQDGEAIGVESFSLNFDDKASGFSNATTATLNVNFTNGASAPAIELGEVIMNDGVLYIEASGLEDFYDEAFRDNIKNTLMEQALYGNQSTTVDCYAADDEEYASCIEESYSTANIDPATKTATSNAIDRILDQIGDIIGIVDGQWIEISIDDILDSDMLSSLDSSTRSTISDSYKCTVNTLNQASNYSSEFTDLYNQNPFINMAAGNDSFYNISFDATNLASYLNTVPNTKFATELAKCYNADLSNTASNITADDISSALEYLPQISARFDGIFNHHLSELKMSEQNDYYSLSTDLKFSYPNNIVVNAPSDSRPVMDVVEEVYQKMDNLQDLYGL
ncbi:MAG: hypothetical protein Q4F56_03295, partial [Candidatus Saccharibacteria bacterium]|nr:hypothetical protein [Candidatus Saccharibacteria bacterium]